MDPLSAARYGMMTATRRFEASAERVARSGDPASGDIDLGGEIVGQIEAKHQFSAATAVMRVADDMWNALISAQEQTQRR